MMQQGAIRNGRVTSRYTRPTVEELNPFPPSAPPDVLPPIQNDKHSLIHELQVQPISIKTEPLVVSEVPSRQKPESDAKQVQIIDRQPQTPKSARSVTWEDLPALAPVVPALAPVAPALAPVVPNTTQAKTVLTPVRSSAEFKPILHIEVAPDGSISQTRKEKPSSRLLARFQRQMLPPSALRTETIRTDSPSVVTASLEEFQLPPTVPPTVPPRQDPHITKEDVSKMIDKGIEEYIRMVAESRWLEDPVGEKISKALLGVPYQEKAQPKIVEFIPYFFNSEYATNDGKSTITDNKLDLLVELIGVVKELRIYPFGDASLEKVGDFSEQTLTLDIKDDENSGKATGKFHIDKDIYVIDIDTVKDSAGQVVEWGAFSLPLIATYSGLLGVSHE